MLKTLLAVVITVGAWLAWHLLADVIGEALEYMFRPILRPVWRTVGNARSPWLLAVMITGGASCAFLGYNLMDHDGWQGTAGFAGFFGGAAMFITAPLLWRDARRDAARRGASASRPVV